MKLPINKSQITLTHAPVLDLMDVLEESIVKTNETPYLFTIRTNYGGYEEESVYLMYTNNPEKTGKELAQEERDSNEDDWDESVKGYWFDGNMVRHIKTKKISHAEAKIWLLAKAIENQY
ncbi:hypothetical protein JCM30760_26580 [Thiomicrorhabdus hydrogeniphila]